MNIAYLVSRARAKLQIGAIYQEVNVSSREDAESLAWNLMNGYPEVFLNEQSLVVDIFALEEAVRNPDEFYRTHPAKY